jgi:hypothetical protein
MSEWLTYWAPTLSGAGLILFGAIAIIIWENP